MRGSNVDYIILIVLVLVLALFNRSFPLLLLEKIFFTFT